MAKSSSVKDVPSALRDLAKLYEDRHSMYGDTDKTFGTIMLSIFPNGILLSSVDDFNRFALYCHMIDKLARYANRFSDGGHRDSLDDNSVYAQMLQEYDAQLRSQGDAELSDELHGSGPDHKP
jgi:hypothetical protein